MLHWSFPVEVCSTDWWYARKRNAFLILCCIYICFLSLAVCPLVRLSWSSWKNVSNGIGEKPRYILKTSIRSDLSCYCLMFIHDIWCAYVWRVYMGHNEYACSLTAINCWFLQMCIPLLANICKVWQAELTFIRFFQISKKIILDIRKKEFVISEILAH